MVGETSQSPEDRKHKKFKFAKDSQGFVTPSSPRTRKQHHQSQNVIFSSQNQFEALSDTNMSMDEIESVEKPRPLKTAARRLDNSSSNSQVKKRSPKPIAVANSIFYQRNINFRPLVFNKIS